MNYATLTTLALTTLACSSHITTSDPTPGALAIAHEPETTLLLHADSEYALLIQHKPDFRLPADIGGYVVDDYDKLSIRLVDADKGYLQHLTTGDLVYGVTLLPAGTLTFDNAPDGSAAIVADWANRLDCRCQPEGTSHECQSGGVGAVRASFSVSQSLLDKRMKRGGNSACVEGYYPCCVPIE